MNKLKTIPRFADEDAERDFWAEHDSTEYIDWSKAEKNVDFPNLKPTENLIELLLPFPLAKELAEEAKKRSLTREDLIQEFIQDGLRHHAAM